MILRVTPLALLQIAGYKIRRRAITPSYAFSRVTSPLIRQLLAAISRCTCYASDEDTLILRYMRAIIALR